MDDACPHTCSRIVVREMYPGTGDDLVEVFFLQQREVIAQGPLTAMRDLCAADPGTRQRDCGIFQSAPSPRP